MGAVISAYRSRVGKRRDLWYGPAMGKSKKRSLTLTLVPGDGIGPEVSEAARRMVSHLCPDLAWEVQDAGAAVFEREGTPLPDRVVESIRKHRVALKGPITTPVGKGFRSVNVSLRKALDLYASFRPVRTIPGVDTRHEDVDLVVVRENTEGLYSGREHVVTPGVVESLRIVTEKASTRIAEAAFQYARMEGRKRVVALHKAMVMPASDGLFLRCARKVADRYPFIGYSEERLDHAATSLVRDPTSYDLLLVQNLYGDFMSDLCAGLVGGLGVVPGSNIGERHAVFEAVHGSAPDIAGQGVANPAALMLSAALMLRHIGRRQAAKLAEEGVRAALADPATRTRDVGGEAGTVAFTEGVLRQIDRLADSQEAAP